METFLIYLGKIALATGAFCIAYLVLFQNRKQFTFNRIYLLVSLAISFVIPMVTFTVVREIPAPVIKILPEEVGSIPYSVVVPENGFRWEWFHTLLLLYAAGVIGFFFYLLAGHAKAIYIIRQSLEKILFATRVNVTGRDVHPFSFFRKIVIPEEILSHPDLEMVIEHEKIHVKEKHTADILLSELLFLFQWFNPFAWLMKDAVKLNLEYKTDDEIVKHFDPQTYQLAMVSLADKKGIAPFLTALNGSQLKNRIVMMKKKTENKLVAFRQLALLPLLAILVMGLSNREVKIKTLPPVTENQIALTSIESLTDKVVKGKITNEKSEPIPEVTVLIKGKTVGTITDLKGNYEIRTENENDTLILGKSGFEKYEVKIGDKTQIDIQLKRTSPLTVQVLKIVDKEDSSSGVQFWNFEEVIENNGNITLTPPKNKKMKMEFHGDQSKQPLFFLNGLEVKDINGINPNDIESVTVLKDKSAIETYGEKGKNGVILIKTKNPLVPVTVTGFPIKTDQKDPIFKNQSEPLTVIGYPSKQDAKDPVFLIVEKMPEFPGGEREFRKFLATSMNYPKEAQQKGIQGVVYVTFVIDSTGKVRDAKIERGIDPLLDNEALRVVGLSPDWQPGEQRGKRVNVKFTTPITFVVNENQFKNPKLPIPDLTKYNTTFDDSVYMAVEKMPEFPGGKIELMRYLNTSVKYPEEAMNKGIQGIVVVKLVIGKTGKVIYTQIARGVHPLLDQEALRVVRSLPDFTPGEQNGRKVIVSVAVPVNFALDEETHKPVIDSLNRPKNLLIVVDEIMTGYKSINDIDPETIKSVNILSGKKATEKYGDKAKDGAIEIIMKSLIIDSEIKLRRFIAKEIRYPVLAQKANREKTVEIWIKLDNEGKPVGISDNSSTSDYIIGEVVVTGYKNNDNIRIGYPTIKAIEEARKVEEQLLVDEAKRVINKIPRIEIDEFKGKTLKISVKFILEN